MEWKRWWEKNSIIKKASHFSFWLSWFQHRIKSFSPLECKVCSRLSMLSADITIIIENRNGRRQIQEIVWLSSKYVYDHGKSMYSNPFKSFPYGIYYPFKNFKNIFCLKLPDFYNSLIASWNFELVSIDVDNLPSKPYTLAKKTPSTYAFAYVVGSILPLLKSCWMKAALYFFSSRPHPNILFPYLPVQNDFRRKLMMHK